MNAAHTPGPWELVAQSDGGWMLVHMKRVDSQITPRSMRVIAHVLARGDSYAEDEANSNLLAAATELAVAARMASEMLADGCDCIYSNSEPDDSRCTCKMLRAALGKAGL